MAEMGAVSRQFKEIGEIIIEGKSEKNIVKGNEIETIVPFDDTLEEQLLGLDIQDYTLEEGMCRVVTTRENLNKVAHSLENM